jgi:outer membrane receptor protein involved in Fe transport
MPIQFGSAIALVVVLCLPGLALAQTAVPVLASSTSTGSTELPPITVLAPTPLLGSGVDRDTVPAETSVLTGADVTRTGAPDMLRALQDTVPGIALDNAAGNQFQPNLFYHGFQASPLQGNQQGLAVYLNGVRFNQAFGDTVNWDLIPEAAIDRINIEGSNPVYGLNALGGAIAVQLKNGFTWQGSDLTISGGSFGTVGSTFQYGRHDDSTSTYVAGSVQHQNGWRDQQSSDLYNFFGDVGWRGDAGELHLNIVAANSTLNGPGTVPVQLLAADPSAQFTGPNQIINKYLLASLQGSYTLSDTLSLQAVVYYQYLLQRVINGNAPDFAPCNDGSGFLCENPGVYLTGRDGNPIPDYLNGGPYSELDQQTTNTNGYGASLQMTDTDTLLDHRNQLVVGASFDGADTLFSGNSTVGGLSSDRNFVGPGVVIDQADGSIVPVRVGITSASYGLFATDSFHITSALTLTASGRFNAIETNLGDQIGTALTGNHSYARFNPALGLTYRVAPWLTVYASYAEANRAPTPAELSCASAASPCSLANFFVGDPDLKQVVAHTVEAGFRGRLHPVPDVALDWGIAYFHTDLADDILFVDSPIQGRAFFQNVGTTQRQGVDLTARLTAKRWSAFMAYSWIAATFQSGFVEASPNNPAADANGNITINPGDRIPGIPNQVLKFGGSYRITDRWTVGATGVAAAGQYLFGDEANLTKQLPAYVVLNFNTSYRLTDHIELFGVVDNVLNTTYYTYGTFSPTASVPIAQAPGATDPRSYSPGAPIAGYVGLHITF